MHIYVCSTLNPEHYTLRQVLASAVPTLEFSKAAISFDETAGYAAPAVISISWADAKSHQWSAPEPSTPSP